MPGAATTAQRQSLACSPDLAPCWFLQILQSVIYVVLMRGTTLGIHDLEDRFVRVINLSNLPTAAIALPAISLRASNNNLKWSWLIGRLSVSVSTTQQTGMGGASCMSVNEAGWMDGST